MDPIYKNFALAEADFELRRERAHTDLPEPEEESDELEQGDPCPCCGTPIEISSFASWHREAYCPAPNCDWEG